MSNIRIDQKRTKIVATLGPSSQDENTLRRLVRGGMNVARINFSHGDHDAHSKAVDDIRRIAKEEGSVVALLCDIQGPKIRIGKIAKEPLILEPGDTITLTLDEADGTNNVVTLPHPEFVRDINAGSTLLLDDGKLEFMVTSTTGSALICEVVVSGQLTSRKGVSAPDSQLTLSAITDKDRADVQFALSKGTEYIAMSFVRSEADIREMKWLIRHLGGNAAIIAKIEMREALDNIESIIAAADGIMVARGDLGVETPAEEVPYHQKRIIALCNHAGKPVITATQMLNSMVDNPRPTRAEASDVYNAIIDGTDAVMLSNETASGKYPVRAIEVMTQIANIAEQHITPPRFPISDDPNTEQHEGIETTADAVCTATTQIADALGCKAIITLTLSGYTTRRVARERPKTPIICATPSELTYTRMSLIWGAIPVAVREFTTIDEMLRIVVHAAVDAHLVNVGDNIIIIAGVPFGIAGQTNFLKIHTVGESGELNG
ncbi:MAG: pyruvate kinase, partial [Anaerolineae bacterium]|nr:pyruvate kinase [Anaerolineae bacterium]